MMIVSQQQYANLNIGPGSFQRMKNNMLTYTQKNKKGMYKKAGLKVQKKLEQAIQTIVVDLVQECEDIR